MLRNINEIIDVAMVNALTRLRTEKPKRIPVKATGNKKALHQKSKNVRLTWMD